MSDGEEDFDDGYAMEEMMTQQAPTEDQMNPDTHNKIDARMGSLPPPEIREVSNNRGGAIASNTGPKGVKADFDEAKLNLACIKMREKLFRGRELQRITGQIKDIRLEPSAPAEEKKPKRGARPNDSDSETDSDLDSDEEEFQKYKQQRLAAIENSLPTFGSYDRVDKEQMINCIKNDHELVFIVIHLYQNHHPHCTLLNLVFESLAPQFPRVRFLRIRSKEAVKGYSDVGLPTLMIYRGGEKVSMHVRVTDELKGGSSGISDYNVAQFLANKGILAQPTEAIANLPYKKTQGTRAAASDDDEDSGSDWDISD